MEGMFASITMADEKKRQSKKSIVVKSSVFARLNDKLE